MGFLSFFVTEMTIFFLLRMPRMSGKFLTVIETILYFWKTWILERLGKLRWINLLLVLLLFGVCTLLCYSTSSKCDEACRVLQYIQDLCSLLSASCRWLSISHSKTYLWRENTKAQFLRGKHHEWIFSLHTHFNCGCFSSSKKAPTPQVSALHDRSANFHIWVSQS